MFFSIFKSKFQFTNVIIYNENLKKIFCKKEIKFQKVFSKLDFSDSGFLKAPKGWDDNILSSFVEHDHERTRNGLSHIHIFQGIKNSFSR